ncbi:hypothetical protein KCTC52924_00942 [Arenibacter antarcticus]|uniref:Type II toxin-antitoxin system RelE/ParE family toxin n=1 Tax=Arenibacter antarcticus TaxID=2040469 RepID=A0ABW5VEG1_9FLAO|nr:type II toxin-antitoxin system RelE/ParE family toxin [Arenibacter sp. H213]MCM4167557.1 hypothetical protein [Arenibacter sp. H213]
MKAIWTRLALEIEDEIIEYLKVKWTYEVLANFLDTVEKTIISLEGNPYMGHIYEINPKYRKILITEHTYFICLVDKELVLILFWPTSQDPEELKMLFT